MLDKVKDYYGKTLQGSADLKTDACCTLEAPPAYMREILSLVHDDVLTRYYGCGLVAPQLMHGLSVLDLGCGAGRDAYVLSAMVGEQGRIVGVDMTEEQLAVASQHRDYHASAFGHAKSNVEFHLGYLEKLSDLGFADDSFDVIVSNCVINLCEDKEAVLAEALRVLKPGGELYFSDVYADCRVPAELVENPILYGECLSGALYWNDFLTIARGVGFADPRLVESRRLAINDAEVKALIGHIDFFSATYRLFKLPELEPACEDYGQAVIYQGSIAHQEKTFSLDAHHHIATGKVFPVCGNTWRMLHDTRFQAHFEFIGNWDRHYGIFEGCGDAIPFDGGPASTEAPCC